MNIVIMFPCPLDDLADSLTLTKMYGCSFQKREFNTGLFPTDVSEIHVQLSSFRRNMVALNSKETVHIGIFGQVC